MYRNDHTHLLEWYQVVTPFFRKQGFTLLETRNFCISLSAEERDSLYKMAKEWREKNDITFVSRKEVL